MTSAFGAFVLGIDPGSEGGIAAGWTTEGRAGVAAAPIPLNGHLVDLCAVRDFVCSHGLTFAQWPVRLQVVLEEQSARPGDGLKGLNYLLPQYGQILGAFNAWGVPVAVVKPQQWKKAILAGTAKDKVAAIERVTLLHPSINLRPGRRRNAHDGMADAVCIAEYGLWALRPTAMSAATPEPDRYADLF